MKKDKSNNLLKAVRSTPFMLLAKGGKCPPRNGGIRIGPSLPLANCSCGHAIGRSPGQTMDADFFSQTCA